ncbi:MAG: DUF393 domain-containing protein [Corynebacteriales bacterium]|nr:DUF393 domain-containing protein [Mycobacteriales bacterium]
MATAVFLYDGDCAFCTTCANFIERRIHSNAKVMPWQFAQLDELGVSQQECEDAVQWISARHRDAGSRAIARLLIDAGSFWKPLGWLLLTPPVSWVAPPIYRLIARNRHRLPGGTAACAMPQAVRDAQRAGS